MNTNKKIKLKDTAEIISGVYLKSVPTGEILCLQVKDLAMSSPQTTAARTEYSPKLENYMLRKGDLLFAAKGVTYICKLFNLNIPALPSTTLYAIRLKSNLITPEFLCWYLNHPSVVAEIKTMQLGSTVPVINKSALENLEIPIPNLKTQQIVVKLSEMQKREEALLKEIAEKRVQITNQILINELNK